MRVALIGARGQLGAAFLHACRDRYDLSAFDRAALDVTDAAAVAREIAACRPEVIVNCSGYNAVDAAEDDPATALTINAYAVRSLARAARSLGATLVQYSSDFVFDGASTTPYTENDSPRPASAYAWSKLLGEWFAAEAPRAYILRVESLFGAATPATDKGSVATIVRALREGSTAKAFDDRIVSPTYVFDAVRATCELIDRRSPPGVYHCVNTGACTWLELAHEAARLLRVEPRIEAVKFAETSFRAARPMYCALSNGKLAAADIVLPQWKQALAAYIG